MQSLGIRACAWALSTFVAVGISGHAGAQVRGDDAAMHAHAVVSQDGAWTSLPQGMPEITKHGAPSIRPREFAAWALDRQTIEKTLASAPIEAQVSRQLAQPRTIELPLPDGRLERFALSEVSVMEPGLAAKFPGFKTYAGQGVDDPAKSIRCELTEVGFTGQIFTPEGVVLIEPYNQFDQQFYAVVRKDVLGQPAMRCLVDAQTPDNNPLNAAGAPGVRMRGSATARTTDNRKTYRLAIATTPNFTAVNGGDAATLSRIVVMTNRLNQIYTQDFNIAFTLVANQNLIIFNSTTNIPPLAYNENSASSMLSVNQSNLNSRIGSANYDAGHVVGAVGPGNTNGVAGAIGNICTSTKGQGVSLGDNTPTDFFVVDYVAHELGHQFGGRHLYNSCGGSQGDSSSIAVEPGSGITIMCYAGICGSPDNIAAHSIPYFNTINIDQIVNYTSTGGGTCFTSSVTGNTGPTVSAGPNYTIPPSTPYQLTATATDPNPNDTLTFSWEQIDGGPARSIGTTSGTQLNAGPLVIPRIPTTSPTRTFPPLANLLNNTVNAQDLLPPAARTMNYRCTVRDPNGGVDSSAMVLTVAGTTPFVVTSPNSAVSVTTCPLIVTWTVAGTNAAPYNAANVKISLSTDGGNTFPMVLSASTPNTGSAVVPLPNVTTTQARIKVEAVGNAFFDISNANFTITGSPDSPFFSLGLRTINDTTGNGNSNGAAEPGESALALTLPINNLGGTVTNVVGTLTSITPTATIVLASSTQTYGTLGPCVTASNASPYILIVSPSHPCGDPINLQLQVVSDQLTSTLNVVIPTGLTGIPISFTYSGPPIAIPDNSTTGVDVVLPVSGVGGTITGVTFSIDGASCSNDPNSTTVGISHPRVSSLVGSLFAPSSATRLLFNRPGTGSNVGSNFCNTSFNDNVSLPQISSINTAGAPYGNAYRPTQTLAAFNGLSPNGNWRFRVADTALGNTGFVRSFTLTLTVTGTVCSPTLVAPPSQCNPADICGVGSTFANGAVDIGPDQQLTIEDFLNFLAAFGDSTGCPSTTLGVGPCNPADICGVGATYDAGAVDIGPDGELSIEDFLNFLAAFGDTTGCP